MAADPPASSAHARGSLAAGGQDRTGTGHQPHRLSPPPELLQSEGEDRGPAEGGAGSRRAPSVRRGAGSGLALPCQQMRGRGGEQRREVDPPAFRLLLGGCAFPLEGLLESITMIQITPQMRILLATTAHMVPGEVEKFCEKWQFLQPCETVIKQVAAEIGEMAEVLQEDYEEEIHKEEGPPSKETKIVSISRDGTWVNTREDGWRQAQVGAVTFYGETAEFD